MAGHGLSNYVMENPCHLIYENFVPWVRMSQLFEYLLQSAGIKKNERLDSFEFDEIITADCNRDEDLSASSPSNSNSVTEPVTRSKRKRNKRRGRSSTASSLDEPQVSKHVNFGSIEQILFCRELSFDKVPEVGTFPLGLGVEIGREHFLVEEIESLREDTTSMGRVRGYSADGKIESSAFSTLKSGLKLKPIVEHERILLIESLYAETKGPSSFSDFNAEIQTVQHSRSNSGCSCKPIKVDKISLSKMKQELLSNEEALAMFDISTLSKADIILRYKEMLKSCELCKTNGCECVKLEVPCNGEVCSCLRGGWRNHSQICGNTNGQIVFDTEQIKLYRQNLLKNLAQSTF